MFFFHSLKTLFLLASRTVGDTKSGESTEQPKASSGGGKITLLVVAGIIIIGAAAFAYNYFKKKVTTEPANMDRELIEITVNKNVDQKTNEESTPAEKKPLLQPVNANGSGVQENQKNGNADEQNKQTPKE